MLVARINSDHKDQGTKIKEARENPESDEGVARAFQSQESRGGGSGETE